MTFVERIPLISVILVYLVVSSNALQREPLSPLRKRVEYCDGGKYGHPTFDDCLEAWHILPYYDDVARQFVSVPVDAPINQIGAPIELPLIRGYGRRPMLPSGRW